MRSQLFGSGGATTGGLFNGAPGPRRSPATSSGQSIGEVKRQESGRNNDGGGGGDRRKVSGKWGGWGGRAGLTSPVLGCVAESLAPARSTHEMSDFMPKMQG